MKIFRAALAGAFLLGLWSGLAWAVQPPAPERIAAGLAARYGGLTALRAAYRRVAAAPATDQVFKSPARQVATGVLYWARPDRLLLDQVSPQPEVMVTDGTTVWWHVPSENLVYRYRNIDVAGELKPLLVFLGGLEALTRDFDLAPTSPDPARPGQLGLELTPREGDRSVDHLTVWCDETFALTGFGFTALTGETTDFFLNGLAENPQLAAGMFAFKIPRGAEVLEEGDEP
ncbi:MAG: outer-membrane lipoprotein carrier protein LolA [Candidatus Adiutrix sp.]|jgi:outer membrane lipoprotein-sorting protein|nr:outer-membrane lipoprotein carrier protein LolA [Candidatus Adiutrix sp.]